MITIYSTPNCANCNSLKLILKGHAIEFKEKQLGVDITKTELDTLVGEPVRAAPIVFYNDIHIGGMGETMLLINDILADKAAENQAKVLEELKAAGLGL
jgi:glutaredoxin